MVWIFLTTEHTEAQRRMSNGISRKRLDWKNNRRGHWSSYYWLICVPIAKLDYWLTLTNQPWSTVLNALFFETLCLCGLCGLYPQNYTKNHISVQKRKNIVGKKFRVFRLFRGSQKNPWQSVSIRGKLYFGCGSAAPGGSWSIKDILYRIFCHLSDFWF